MIERARGYVMVSLVAIASACGPSSAPRGSAPPPDGAEPPRTKLPPAPESACTDPKPSDDAVCVQDCGPPAARESDPLPGFHWLSPADAERRAQFGCPICLPSATRISTPRGDVAVQSLSPGMSVWTATESGARVAAVIVHVGSVPAPEGHAMVRLSLADGRIVTASADHPDAAARALGALLVGDSLDGSRIVERQVVPYTGERTWDILPSGPTGTYWADGVLVGSTLRARTQTQPSVEP